MQKKTAMRYISFFLIMVVFLKLHISNKGKQEESKMPVKKISGILMKIIASVLILVGLIILLLLMVFGIPVVGFIAGGIPIILGVFLFLAGRKLFKS